MFGKLPAQTVSAALAKIRASLGEADKTAEDWEFRGADEEEVGFVEYKIEWAFTQTLALVESAAALLALCKKGAHFASTFCARSRLKWRSRAIHLCSSGLASRSWASATIHRRPAAPIVLCLPSVIGGLVLLTNLLLQRHPSDWGDGSAVLVAPGVFLGRPMVAIATMMGLAVALRPSVSAQMKSAHLIIVVLGVMATISLWFRFHW